MFSKILTENDFTGALMNILKLEQSLKKYHQKYNREV